MFLRNAGMVFDLNPHRYAISGYDLYIVNGCIMSKTVYSQHQKIANNQSARGEIGKRASNYALARKRFDDFEEFATAIRAWDLDFRQLDRGRSSPEFTQVMGPDMHFTYARFDRHYHQQGSTPAGMRTFALLEDTVSGVHWFGREVTSSSLVCFPASRELEAVSRPDFNVYTISVSKDLLAETVLTIGLSDLDKTIRKEDRVVNCDPTLLQAIRRKLREILDYSLHNSLSINHPDVKHILETELPALILEALTVSLDVNNFKPVQWKKQQAIKKAHEYLREFDNDSISISALCQFANVSLRTLEYAFKEYYGVTPKNYLTAMRLSSVRKELRKNHSQSTSITDIANQWDFWHMGQFAADYKRLFGELPSETVKKA